MAKVGFKTFCSAPLSLLAFAAFAAFPSGVFGYTSASYEQSGLIAQWDGIDNAGTGVHDPTATVWKDLKGAYDLSLLPNGGWSASGNALVVNGASAVCSNSLPAYKTIEVVYKMTDPKGRILFTSGGYQTNSYRFVIFNRYTTQSAYNNDYDSYITENGYLYESTGTNAYFSGVNTARPLVVWDSFDSTAVRSMSATYDNTTGNNGLDGQVSAVYANGVARSDGSYGNNWGTGDGKIMIGDRVNLDAPGSHSSSHPWYGEVYTIRIYNRALTAEEIAANYAIDEARFITHDYVADGLIAQWDAIDNAGTGVHDPTATVWKDLAGNYDLSLLPNGGWSASGNALVVNGASAVCSNSLPAYKTIEVVYKMTDPKGRILFTSGGYQTNSYRFVIFNRYTTQSAYNNDYDSYITENGYLYESTGTNAYFSGVNTARPLVVWDSFDSTAVRSMSATYDNTTGNDGLDGQVSAVYANGAARSDGSYGNNWGTGDGKIMIGDRVNLDAPGSHSSSHPWYGEVYSIRIYNRALAAEEIAANYKLDMERFATHYWGGTDGSFGTAGLWKNPAGETVQSIPGAGNDICIKEGAHEHTDQNISLDTDRTVASLTVTNGNVRASGFVTHGILNLAGHDLNVKGRLYFDSVMGTDSDGPGSESVRGGKLTVYGGGTMTVGSVKIGTDETEDPNPQEQYPQYGETYGSGTLNVQGPGTVFTSAGDIDMQGPWTLLCVTNGARFAASNFTMHCGWARGGGADVGIARFSGSGTFVSLKTFAMGRNGAATVSDGAVVDLFSQRDAASLGNDGFGETGFPAYFSGSIGRSWSGWPRRCNDGSLVVDNATVSNNNMFAVGWAYGKNTAGGGGATLTLQNNAKFVMRHQTAGHMFVGLAVAGADYLDNNATNSTLNVLSGATLEMASNSSELYVSGYGNTSFGKVNVSNATVNVGRIKMGAKGTYSAASNACLTVSGTTPSVTVANPEGAMKVRMGSQLLFIIPEDGFSDTPIKLTAGTLTVVKDEATYAVDPVRVVVDALDYGKKNSGKKQTLIECYKDSTDALTYLSTNLVLQNMPVETRRRGILSVEDGGKKLVYTALTTGLMAIFK